MDEIDGIIDLGYEVVLCPIKPSGQIRSDWKVPDGVRLEVIQPHSLEVFTKGILGLLSMPKLLQASLRMTLASPRHTVKNLSIVPKCALLASALRGTDIQHVHAYWASVPASMGLLLSAQLRAPWSFTAHRWDIYENNALNLKISKALFVRFISLRGLADARQVAGRSGEFVYVPLGVAIPNEVSKPTLDVSNVPLLAVVANLIPLKGHWVLFNAMSLLRDGGFRTNLFVIGDGPEMAPLQGLADELGLTECITFMGQLSRSDLLRMYRVRAVDLVVSSSLERGFGQHEGVPIALVEAMSFAIPVVATDSGSCGELLDGGHHLLAKSGDAEDLARKILRVLASERAYVEASNWCRARVLVEWNSQRSAGALMKMVGV